MRRSCFRSLFVLLILAAVLLATPALAADIRVTVNGEALSMDVPPRIEDGRTLVPIRAIMEGLGLQVDYISSSKSIEIYDAGTQIHMQLGSKAVTVNGAARTLDVPAKEVNGRTLVPLRFIGESVGAEVEWIGEERLVRISYQQTPVPDPPPIVKPSGSISESCEKTLLSRINQKRALYGLDKLVSVNEMVNMARQQSQDMFDADLISANVSARGNTAARAAYYSLPVPAELLSAGYISAQQVFDTWMKDQKQRAALMNEKVRFIGLGALSSSDGTYWVTAETLSGSSFFLGQREYSSSVGSRLSFNGICATESVGVSIYYYDNAGNYISRSYQTANVSNGRFALSCSFPKSGSYLLQTDGDSIRVNCR